jgi:hypothetical protein
MVGSCKIAISVTLACRILNLSCGLCADNRLQNFFGSPADARFSLLHSVQPSSGTHRSSYPMDTGGYSSEGIAVGA